jgi:hypothetical protein
MLIISSTGYHMGHAGCVWLSVKRMRWVILVLRRMRWVILVLGMS